MDFSSWTYCLCKKVKKTHPYLKFGEITARGFRTKYQKLLKKQSSKISLQKTGRPLMLRTLDEKVKTFLHVLRRNGGVVNTVVAVVTAKSLIARNPDEHLKRLDLDSSYCAKSLFRRIGFTKQTCITSKPEIQELAKKETKLMFHHQIADLVERHSIPPSLLINFDKTPIKCLPVVNQKLSRKGSKHVAIKGLSFKKPITATFEIIFSLKFLPMQLIYGGKTQSLPRMKVPNSFSLSANEKHFSNTQVSLKPIVEIITPYVEKEREVLNLGEQQQALLIIDVFSGQMTNPVIEKLKENIIKLTRVPANMKNHFQSLDLTVNGSSKTSLKKKFTE